MLPSVVAISRSARRFTAASVFPQRRAKSYLVRGSSRCRSSAVTEALLLPVPGAAEALSVSTRLVEKLIAAGELRSLRLGRRARRIPREAIVEYIARLAGEQDHGTEQLA